VSAIGVLLYCCSRQLPRGYYDRKALTSASGEIARTADFNSPDFSSLKSVHLNMLDGGTLMKRVTFFLVAVAAMAGVVALIAPARGHADGEPAPFVTEIPQGYRDWRWISSAHEAGNLNSLGALLGNDVAIKAYREGKLPFPDGTILAALHYRNVPSEENNKIFGQAQSFVPGAPTNIQFMVKDSVKYAATGGWGFGHFADGKHGDAAFMKSCFPCHEKTTATDLVFTHYAP
jgi:Cytochrome P460